MGAIQRSLGLIGGVLLLFAGLAAVFMEQVDNYVRIHFVLGLLALVVSIVRGREQWGAFLGQRSTRYGVNAVLYSVLFVGILVMANYLGTRYNHRFDTTEARIYSLSPQSTGIVENLEKELELVAFVETGKNPYLEDLFTSYADASERIDWRILDPDRHPDLAERYNIAAYNTVRVAYGDQATLVTEPSEQKITNAIIKVTSADQKTICIPEGHGEPDPDDMEQASGLGALAQALENENYQVRKFLLAAAPEVPGDCSVLLVPAPRRPYLDGELERLETWLRNEGRAVFLFSARAPNHLASVVAELGIQVGDDAVVDQVLRLFQGPALGLEPIAETYGAHRVTRNFSERTVFPMTRSVRPPETPEAGIQVTALVQTAPTSWAESDLTALFEQSEVTLDPAEDQPGPLPIAVAASGEMSTINSDAEGELRVVVFGSQDFVNNRSLGSFYNRDLILNAVGWTAGEEELLSIRPRTLRASRVQLTPGQIKRIFQLSVLFLPELLLLAGIAVWASRRGK